MSNTLMLVVPVVFVAILASAQNTKQSEEGTAQKRPCDAATTQLELNKCFGEEFSKTDTHLNRVYASLVKQLSNEMAIQKLKVVEKTWIRYRNLDCEAARSEFEGGSMSPMVWAQCMAMTSKHRIEELKAAYETGERKLE